MDGQELPVRWFLQSASPTEDPDFARYQHDLYAAEFRRVHQSAASGVVETPIDLHDTNVHVHGRRF